jgi:hypothetical protein
LKIIDYQILSSGDPQTLSRLVKDGISKGWQPWAGMTNRGYEETHTLHQAMVQYEEPALDAN